MVGLSGANRWGMSLGSVVCQLVNPLVKSTGQSTGLSRDWGQSIGGANRCPSVVGGRRDSAARRGGFDPSMRLAAGNLLPKTTPPHCRTAEADCGQSAAAMRAG